MQGTDFFDIDGTFTGDSHQQKHNDYNSKYTIVLAGTPRGARLPCCRPLASPPQSVPRAGRSVAIAIHGGANQEVKFMRPAGWAPHPGLHG